MDFDNDYGVYYCCVVINLEGLWISGSIMLYIEGSMYIIVYLSLLDF